MAATNNKLGLVSSAAITTTGIASMATSSTLTAGWSYAEIDNTTNLYLDYWISGKNTVGTTPTANTVIETWIIPKREDSSYHDTFDGTNKAVTVTSRAMLRAYGFLLRSMDVDVATSDRGYEFNGGVWRTCDFFTPLKFQVFITHNTGVNLNSTAGNHVAYQKGVYTTSGG